MPRKQLRQILTAVAFAFGLSAQEYRGRVQGSVTDGSQAAVSGATVTLSNVDTGVVSTRQTTEQGRYLFDLVLPGKYTVAVQLQGFNKFVQANVVLQSRSDVTVDAVLRPGDVRETVTVEAQASTVQFNTSKLETTVDSALVSNLPQMSRNPLLLARLDPAVVQIDTAREVEPYMTWSGNRQQIGGGRDYSNDLPNRTDYVLNEKLRFYGRYSKLWTPVTTSNPTGSDFYVNDRGSQRDALSISGDAVYMLSATTILNVNATYHSFVDASQYAPTANVGWDKIWPNSSFHKTIFANKAVPELLPRMSIMGTGTGEYWTAMGPRGGTWNQRPTAGHAWDAHHESDCE